MKRTHLLGLAAVVNLFVTLTAQAATIEVIPWDATWEYFEDITRAINQYPDTQQSAAWYHLDYDSANPGFGSWQTGVAPFGYGVLNAVGLPFATPLNQTASTHNTALFRTSFSLDNAGAQAITGTAGIICDDGCIGYVNGIEVFRFNMPAGPVEPETFSAGVGNENSFTDVAMDLSSVLLVVGSENVFALEVHQVSSTSSDFGFAITSASVEAIPEPSAAIMLSLGGLFCVLGVRRRR